MAPTPLPPRAPRQPLAALGPTAIDDTTLKEDGLRDAVLEHANLANRRGVRVLVERVRMRGCRLTGLQLGESTLRDLVVEDSRVDLAAFRGSRVERVVFRDCQLQELDLVEAQLSSVVFEACDLSGADFRHARFARSQMRGCTLTGATGIERLRGVSMPWPDIVGFAGEFAAALGIGVIEAEEEA
ncbi:MAG TPA: pentapeptide repeat-containing protein [Conexibacter sp.]|jgi:uncharacterized protein YjbI with pentapeptide repeats